MSSAKSPRQMGGMVEAQAKQFWRFEIPAYRRTQPSACHPKPSSTTSTIDSTPKKTTQFSNFLVMQQLINLQPRAATNSRHSFAIHQRAQPAFPSLFSAIFLFPASHAQQSNHPGPHSFPFPTRVPPTSRHLDMCVPGHRTVIFLATLVSRELETVEAEQAGRQAGRVTDRKWNNSWGKVGGRGGGGLYTRAHRKNLSSKQASKQQIIRALLFLINKMKSRLISFSRCFIIIAFALAVPSSLFRPLLRAPSLPSLSSPSPSQRNYFPPSLPPFLPRFLPLTQPNPIQRNPTQPNYFHPLSRIR